MMDASFPVLLKVTLLNEGKYDIRNSFFFKISHFHGTYRDWGKTPVWRFMFF